MAKVPLLTKEQIREEWFKCGKDPVYFIRKYVKIRHPTRGLISFELFDYQEKLVNDFLEHRFNIVLKGRQLGITEIYAAISVWLMIFKRQRNIIVMATKADTSKNLVKRVHTALKSLPPWLCSKNGGIVHLLIENRTSLELDNGSIIKAIASSDDAGRSEAVSLLIIDEAAHIKNLEELWTGLYPTVQAGGRVAVLSTPNGVGNTFYNLYVDAEKKLNDFYPTKLMWWVHPEKIRDGNGNFDLVDDPMRPGHKTSSWFRKEIAGANYSQRQISQELECSFLGSGETVISPESLEWLSTKCVYEPKEKVNLDRNLFIWSDPVLDVKYFLSADVARGDGEDYSACIVWEASSMTQMAEYYGKITPDEFAQIICSLGNHYNKCLVVVENNTIGLACLEHIRLNQYENVYFSRRGDMKAGEAISMQWGSVDEDLIPGFITSSKTRPLIIAKLEEYIRTKIVTIRSVRLLNELRQFVWKDGRPQAQKGFNDDLVMSAAIGVWIRDTFIAPTFVSIDAQRKMLDCITSERNLNTQVPGASKDPRLVPQTSLGIFTLSGPKEQHKVEVGNGLVLDFSWLLQK